MSIISVEIILLDLRYFLDEALTFIEFYEYGERDLTRAFQTSQQVILQFHKLITKWAIFFTFFRCFFKKDIFQLRQFAIEYIRLVIDLKKLCKDNGLFADFNMGLHFSEQFKDKRIFFFTTLFKRLEKLYTCIYGETALSNELVKLYFKTIQKLVRNSNEFIGYLEASRWSRDIALQILDKLVENCNDFLCVFEKVSYEPNI